MESISRYYNQACKQKYQPIGFSKNKTILARIRGDVIQAFTFKRFQNVPSCTVDFGIFPLCMPEPIFLEAGGYELDAFIVEQQLRYSGWAFDPDSNKSMEKCIESVSEAIDLYLLPFFDRCSDCKSALPELIKLEELFDRNRQRVLYLRGESDSAVPWQERSLFDSRKYYMALKSHNFSYAQHFLNHQVDFYETKLQLFDNPNSPKQPDIVRERFLAKRAFCSEQLERLDSGNFVYFDDLLKTNERQMLKFIASKYPKIQSNK